MTILWKLFPETPQIMMCFFCIIGCCHRIYLIPPWIQCLGQPFDGSAFSTGIPAFKCQHHRNPVFIKFIMKLGKSCLKTCKFFFVLFFFHLLWKVYSCQYGTLKYLLLLCCSSCFLQSILFLLYFLRLCFLLLPLLLFGFLICDCLLQHRNYDFRHLCCCIFPVGTF